MKPVVVRRQRQRDDDAPQWNYRNYKLNRYATSGMIALYDILRPYVQRMRWFRGERDLETMLHEIIEHLARRRAVNLLELGMDVEYREAELKREQRKGKRHGTPTKSDAP